MAELSSSVISNASALSQEESDDEKGKSRWPIGGKKKKTKKDTLVVKKKDEKKDDPRKEGAASPVPRLDADAASRGIAGLLKKNIIGRRRKDTAEEDISPMASPNPPPANASTRQLPTSSKSGSRTSLNLEGSPIQATLDTHRSLTSSVSRASITSLETTIESSIAVIEEEIKQDGSGNLPIPISAVTAAAAQVDPHSERRVTPPASPLKTKKSTESLLEKATQIMSEIALPVDPANDPVSWTHTVSKEIIKDLQKKDLKRQEMIYELIQTERAFFRNLVILKHLFRRTISMSKLVTSMELRVLFSDLDGVLSMNTPICKRLCEVQAQFLGRPVQNIGPSVVDLFKSVDPEVYALFCSEQKQSVALYHLKLKSDPKFAQLMAQIEDRPECSRLKFPDFVAKVFQRLSKYPLLFAGILKNTPSTAEYDAERAALKQAEGHTTSVLQVVDAYIKRKQDRERLLFIQKQLDFSACGEPLSELKRLDLTLGKRTLVREGTLDIVVDHAPNKELHVILFSDVILFTQMKDGQYLLKCSGKNLGGRAKSPVLLLKDTHVRQEAAQNKGILLINKTDACMYQLRAMSKKIQQEWLKDLTECCNSCGRPDAQHHALFRETKEGSSANNLSQPATHHQPLNVSFEDAKRPETISPRASIRRSTMPALARADKSRSGAVFPRRIVRLLREWAPSSTKEFSFGLSFCDVPTDILEMDTTLEQGMMVLNVENNSAAARGGIQHDDILVAMNGEPVSQFSPEDLKDQLDSQEYLDLLVATVIDVDENGEQKEGVFAQRSLKRRQSLRRLITPEKLDEMSDSDILSDGKSLVVSTHDIQLLLQQQQPSQSQMQLHSQSPHGSEKRLSPMKSGEATTAEIEEARKLARQASDLYLQTAKADLDLSSELDVFAQIAKEVCPDSPVSAAEKVRERERERERERDHSVDVLHRHSPTQLVAMHSNARSAPSVLVREVSTSELTEESSSTSQENSRTTTPHNIDEEKTPEPGSPRENTGLGADDAETSQQHHSLDTENEFEGFSSSDLLDLLEDNVRESPLPTGFIVIDFGTTMIRVGLAGEDAPRFMYRSLVGTVEGNPEPKVVIGSDAVAPEGPVSPNDLIELVNPIAEFKKTSHSFNFGVFAKDAMKKILTNERRRYCLFIVDEYNQTTTELLTMRHHMAEFFFSNFSAVDGILFSNQVYLSCLGSSRRCALVVHVGETGTTVMPVIRSRSGGVTPEPLIYASRRAPFGGRFVTQSLAQMLESQTFPFEEAVGHPMTSEQGLLVVQSIKEQMCYVSLDYAADVQSCNQSSALEMAFEMEDGHVILLGHERFRCVEPLFTNHEHQSIPSMIVDAIHSAPPEYQDELWSNIVLSGGTTLMAGFEARLRKDLYAISPGLSRQLDIVSFQYRRLLPWIGAAIFANQDFARERFVTREVHTQNTYIGSNPFIPSIPHDIITSSPYAVDIANMDSPLPLNDGIEETVEEHVESLMAAIMVIDEQILQLQQTKDKLQERLKTLLGEEEGLPADGAHDHKDVSPQSPLLGPAQSAGPRRSTGDSADAERDSNLSVVHDDANELSENREGAGEPSGDEPGETDTFSEGEPATEGLSPDFVPPIETSDTFTAESFTPSVVETDFGAKANTSYEADEEDEEPALVDEFLGVTKSAVQHWDESDVASWMTMVDLDSLVSVFRDNGIQGIDLLDLCDADLLSMGIKDGNLRLRILREAELLTDSSPHMDLEQTLAEFDAPWSALQSHSPMHHRVSYDGSIGSDDLV